MIKDINIIKKHLKDCSEIELPYPFEKEVYIKYITFKDGEEVFSLGGKFMRLLDDKIILSNAGKSWTVPINLKNKKGDIIYICSDAYADHFGGQKGKKFMIGKFKKLLLSVHKKEMAEQKSILENTLKEWMKDHEQIDDICVMGVRV